MTGSEPIRIPARGQSWLLRRVAAATEEAVFGPFAGLVELRRLRPHLVDRGQRAGNRRRLLVVSTHAIGFG